MNNRPPNILFTACVLLFLLGVSQLATLFYYLSALYHVGIEPQATSFAINKIVVMVFSGLYILFGFVLLTGINWVRKLTLILLTITIIGISFSLSIEIAVFDSASNYLNIILLQFMLTFFLLFGYLIVFFLLIHRKVQDFFLRKN